MKKLKDLVPWPKKSSSLNKQSDAPFLRLQQEIDDFFKKPLSTGFFGEQGLWGDHGWYPKVDVREGKKQLTVEAEIPGVDPSDIDLSLDGRVLRIKGEKKSESEDRTDGYYHFERAYGFFNRKIELPADVDPEKVEASFKKGVLKIKLRKTKEAETKRIEVRAA